MPRHIYRYLPCLMLCLTLPVFVSGCSLNTPGTSELVPQPSKLMSDATDGKVTLKPGKATNSRMVTQAGSGASPYVQTMSGKSGLGVLDGKSSGYIVKK